MESYGNFSQIFTQISNSFASEECKTKSLQLVEDNYLSEDEFMLKIQQMSYEIPLFKTIIKYRDLFTLFIQQQLLLSIAIQNLIEIHKNQEIGVGANAKVFVNFYKDEYFDLKSMEKVNLNMLESYIQECINQYNLLKVNKEYILNFSGLVYISIINSQASIYIPLELAEYSLFDFIQNNEITQEYINISTVYQLIWQYSCTQITMHIEILNLKIYYSLKDKGGNQLILVKVSNMNKDKIYIKYRELLHFYQQKYENK